MRKDFLIAGVAVAAFIPALASAQTACDRQSSNRAVGTDAGAGDGSDRTVGALLVARSLGERERGHECRGGDARN